MATWARRLRAVGIVFWRLRCSLQEIASATPEFAMHIGHIPHVVDVVYELGRNVVGDENSIVSMKVRPPWLPIAMMCGSGPVGPS